MLDQLILLDGETIGARTTYITVDHTSESTLQAVTGSTHHPLAYGPLFKELFGQDVGRSDFTIESIASGERPAASSTFPSVHRSCWWRHCCAVGTRSHDCFPMPI
jgi:hypothetical protein